MSSRASATRTRLPDLAGCLTLVLLVLTACGLNRTDLPEEDMPEPTIQEVQERYTPDWMELPGVVGTGIGLCEAEDEPEGPGEPCIRVFLARPSPEAEDAIPERVEGYRVELVVTGEFRPRGP
jgi:hypothetical protein